MKKLMIAVAIVCAAAMSQAASATWSTGKVFAAGDTTGMGDNPVSYTWAIAELATADVSGISFANGVLTGATQIDASDAPVSITAWGSPSTLGGTLEGATAGAYYALCIWSSEFQNWGVSDAVLAEINPAAIGEPTLQSMLFNNRLGDPYAEGGLYAKGMTMSAMESVPEPTSGLLLLLGVAGMALRRRRA